MMNYAVRLYRLSKPVVICTSYLFTALTMLYLLMQTLFPVFLPFHPRVLWGIFFFSLGSMLARRFFLESGFWKDMRYRIRLFSYLCTTGIWGYVCLRLLCVSGGLWEQAKADGKGFLLILLAGLFCCAGFELFNCCRAHMYNMLLEQYKRRRQA